MYPKTKKECSVDECEKLALINTKHIVCSEHLFSDLNELENENHMSETCDVVNCSAESESKVLITDLDGGTSQMRLCKSCEIAYKIGKRDE